MSYKHILSLSLLTFILQGCGDTPDEKKLKRKNDELSRQNTELTQEKNQTVADRDAALAEAQQELDSAKQNLKKAQDDKAAVEKTKAGLETELAAKQKTATDLKEEIKNKDAAIAAKEVEITSLTATVAASSTEVAKLQESLKTAQGEVSTLTTERDQLKTTLAQATAASATVKAELEGQLAAKDKLVKEKEGEIATLTAKLATLAATPDLTSAQNEIAKLKEELAALKTALAAAESASTALTQELTAANTKISDLEGQLNSILQKSLVDVHGLWLNEEEVAGITDSVCYEFVHLAADGNFAQAIACGDGRVQIQKHAFDRFGAQGVPVQTANDYMASYGFAVDGAPVSSSCQDPAASTLKPGARLVFEMTRQDFGSTYGNLMSKNLVVTSAQGLKGFTNAALNFANNRLDYAAMAAVAGRPSAGPLSKAAAAFLGGLTGQGANVTLGCFDANGVFTAASSN